MTASIFMDALRSIGYFLKKSMVPLSNVLIVMLPYAMMYITQYCYYFRNCTFAYGGEYIVPVIVLFVIWLLRSYADRLGTGLNIPPVPEKRFTKVDSDGEVSIDKERLQEMILYVGDLEDWLEKRHYSK